MAIIHSRKRKTIRLKEYDYSTPGNYFVTICTFDKQNIFGDVIHGEMQVNSWGMIVQEEWQRTSALRRTVILDAFVCMPNHLHGIIGLMDDGRGTSRRVPTSEQFGKPMADSIPTIVRLFKSSVTMRINRLCNTPAQPIWQRGYYEHVIRGDRDLDNIRRYIIGNPTKWEIDEENPETI